VNRFLGWLLLVCSAVCLAQTPQIKSGATVYIEPMGGYETYLAAAIVKKHVPLIVVADKDKAEYIIRSTVHHTVPSRPAVVVNNTTNVNTGGNDAWDKGWELGRQMGAHSGSSDFSSASIAVIDAQSSQIVFAYAANVSVDKRTAESCAKHLKAFIEKQKK
jgi:hypothetical protein